MNEGLLHCGVHSCHGPRFHLKRVEASLVFLTRVEIVDLREELLFLQVSEPHRVIVVLSDLFDVLVDGLERLRLRVA